MTSFFGGQVIARREYCAYMIMWLMLLASCGALFVDVKINDQDWFARFGALMVGSSILVIIFAQQGRKITHKRRLKNPIKLAAIREFHITASYIVAFLGTLIWAFGDFVGPN